MIDTILFDLDGTLLRFNQDVFVKTYFAKLAKVFKSMGFDPDLAVKAVWAGTKAMVLNDGNKKNSERFWDGFADVFGLSASDLKRVRDACDDFYTNEFNTVKTIVDNSDIPKNLLKTMKNKGYKIILATNPLFPECGVFSRLGWGDIDADVFSLITHYDNSTFCKPNPGYYREILNKIGKSPDQCLMVGNNATEDMVAGELGMFTYLVTDCLENEMDLDISVFKHGTLVEMENYLLSMPDIQ